MKTIYKCLGLLASSAVFFSCEKEILESEQSDLESLTEIVKTVTLDPQNVQLKSSYIPGEGLKMSGDEPLAAFYGDAANYGMSRAQAVALGNRQYSISHAALPGATAYNYWFFIPALPSVSLDGTDIQAKLSPIQMPEQNSFDSNYDFLLGKAANSIAPSEESIELNQLKRVAWPFVIDVNNDFSADKIHAATISFDGADSQVAGVMNLICSDDFSKSGVSKVTKASNAATAIYPEGLSKTGNAYPVWYMLKAGKLTGNMTLNVVTDHKTFTESISLGAGIEVKEQFNRKKDGFTFSDKAREETSMFIDLTNKALDLTDVRDIEGNKLTVKNASVYDGKGTFTNGVLLKDNYSIVLPAVANRKINRIRVYFHSENKLNDLQNQGFVDFQEPIISGLSGSVIAAISYTYTDASELPFSVLPSAKEISAGQSVTFQFTGKTDELSVYTGESGHNYLYRDGHVVNPKYYYQFDEQCIDGQQENQLHVYVSKDFDGTHTMEGIKAATWTDISSRFTLLGPGKVTGERDFVNCGRAEITDLIDKENTNLIFAFNYTAEPYSKHKLGTNIVRIKNPVVSTEYEQIKKDLYKWKNYGWEMTTKSEQQPERPSLVDNAKTWLQFRVGWGNMPSGKATYQNSPTDNWAISVPLAFEKSKDLGADTAIAVKAADAEMPASFEHTFKTAGTYEVVFVAKNAKSQNEEIVKVQISVK